LSAHGAEAQAVATNARIVIIGAGAAGTALANRLVDAPRGGADHVDRPAGSNISTNPA
jgi:cation diffusion facilitator CzcD-associated flavoprotein CzcO